MDATDDGIFELRETQDGATVQVTPCGELDIESTRVLSARLDALKAAGTAVHLDLAQIEFMDSTGVACIAQAVREAGRDDWALTVGHELQGQVARLMELVDGESLFWPVRR